MDLTGPRRPAGRALLVIAISVVGAWAFPSGKPEAQFIYGPETEEFWVLSAQVTSDGKPGSGSRSTSRRCGSPSGPGRAGTSRRGTLTCSPANEPVKGISPQAIRPSRDAVSG